MSVIIRLQGLPWSASALDIRQFFKGLTIPAGGVHIIGGERGDAFIAFSSDEDARQAMMRNMSAINGTPVQLFLSSKTEMQNVIEEARNADAIAAGMGTVPSAPVASAAAAPHMMQQKPASMQPQGSVQPGMPQDFQKQQGFQGGVQGMPNQRLPQQPAGFQMGRNMNQGHFTEGQNYMGGQMIPGQLGREGQAPVQQGMNQNYQMGQQLSGLTGQQNFSDRSLAGANGPQGQQNQSNFGYGPNAFYGGNNLNYQWQQNSGQTQGKDVNSVSQPFFAHDDSSQGAFSTRITDQRPEQYGQPNAGNIQFPQQQFGSQGGDGIKKGDSSLGLNQSVGFGQENLQQQQSGIIPMRGGRVAGPPEMNRAGILPHPAMSVKSEDDERTPDSQSGQMMPGHVAQRPGAGPRSIADEPVRAPLLGRPGSQQMEQWGTHDQGQHGDTYNMEREGFPHRRGEGFPQRGGIGRGRGMLPTPDMPPQGKQPGILHDGQGDNEADQSWFLGDGRGMVQGRETRNDPDFRYGEEDQGHGHYREGDSDFRGRPDSRFEEQQRGRFGPEDRSFDQGSEGRNFERGHDGRPIERGPDGRPFERGSEGRQFERGPDGRAFERGPDGRPFERGSDRRPFERGPDGRPLDRGPDGRPFERGPDGRPFERGPDGRPFERGPDGRPFERGPDGRPFERGPDGRPFERGPDGRPFERGPDGRPFERGPDGRPFERGPDGRPFERGPDGRPFERGPDGRPFERGPDGRPFEHGPDGRPFEYGPDGRPFQRGPDGRPFERGPDGRPFERGPDGRPMLRPALDRSFEERGLENKSVPRPLMERPLEKGPDGKIIERVPDRIGPDGRPIDRILENRPVERPALLDREGRLIDRGPDGRAVEPGPDGHPMDSDGRFPDRLSEGQRYFEMGQERGQQDETFQAGQDRRPLDRGPDGRPIDRASRPFEKGPNFGRVSEGRPFEERFGPEGRFDGPVGRLGGEGHFGQQDNVDSYDHMDMDVDPPSFEEPVLRGHHETGFQADGVDRGGFGGRGGRGRGMDTRGNIFRGRGGFDRGRGRGFGRGFHHHGHPGETEFQEYPIEEGFDGSFMEEENVISMQEGLIPRDFDSRMEGGITRGDAERGRGGMRGRVDGPHGKSSRGQPPHDTDTDRRFSSHQMREDFTDVRGTGKGLLGDAPVGLLPDPISKEEGDKDSRPGRAAEIPRERDRRGHSRDRRDRDDRDRRDDRRRSDRRRSIDRSRDRSSDRDRHRDRRSDRSKDRDRDRRDRDRERNRDRIDSRDKDRDLRSKDNGKKEEEKELGKDEKKAEDHKKSTTEPPKTEEEKYINVKGFPNTYNYREVRRFFYGCELPYDGLKLINNTEGQRTGEAYLKFVNEETAKRALKKNGETIFGKPVVISSCTSKAFETAVDSQSPSTPGVLNTQQSSSLQTEEKSNLVVLVRGLPFNIKREDLLQFFSSVKIADNGNALCIDYDNRNQTTGLAYLEAATVLDFKNALSFDGRILGPRPIQVAPGKKEDMDLSVKKQQEVLGQKRINEPPQPSEQQQQQQPVAQQQQQQPVAQQQQQPGMGLLNRPLLGQIPSKPQSLLSLPMSTQQNNPRNGPSFENKSGQRPQQQQQQQSPQQDESANQTSYCVHIQGLPMLATYKDIRDFFDGLNIATHRGVQIVHDGMGKPMGEGFVEFATQEDKDKALKKDKTSMGRHILAVKSVAKADMIERLRNARFVGLPPGQGPPPLQQRGGLEGSMQGPGGAVKPIPPGVLNRQWSYLSCQNFPPNISITDILAFFHGYNPIPESIRLHYAADGSPTGNAVVGFPKIEDANLALHELNGKLCRRSMVTLMPAM